MNRLHVFVAAVCAAAVCGCTPKAVTTATVESVKFVCVCADGSTAMYLAGVEQQALLREEFETWKRAGFDGFGVSFVTYAPGVRLMGMTSDGVGYSIDFGQNTVAVNEVYKDGESSQYVRDATVADRRFKVFLLACVADGKLPRAKVEEPD